MDKMENQSQPEENLVKKTCRELGITQKELAERLGVNDGTPAQWNIKGNIPKWGEHFMNLMIENHHNKLIANSFKNLVVLSQRI
jgi:predicted transcriptional regulator